MDEIEKLERTINRTDADVENDVMDVTVASHDVSSSDGDDDDDACQERHGNISIDSQNFLNL